MSAKYSQKVLKVLKSGFVYQNRIDAIKAKAAAMEDRQAAGRMLYGAWMMGRKEPDNGPYSWLMSMGVHEPTSFRAGKATCSCALVVPWPKKGSDANNFLAFANQDGHMQRPHEQLATFFIARFVSDTKQDEYRYFCSQCGPLRLAKKNNQFGQGFRQGDFDEAEFNFLRREHQH